MPAPESTRTSRGSTRKPPVPKFRATKKKQLSPGQSASTLALVIQRTNEKEDFKRSNQSVVHSSPRSPLRKCSSPRLVELYTHPLPGSSSPLQSNRSRRSSRSPTQRQRRIQISRPWCATETEVVDELTLWENTHRDVSKLQTKLEVREPVRYEPVAPHAFGCRSKDLAAFCWKGCRNFTSLDESYDDKETMATKLDQLESTVYSQGVALHAAEMKAKEQEQSLQILQHEIFEIVHWAAALRSHEPSSETPPAELLAVKAILYRFDLDNDGVLSMTEMNALKAALGHETKYTEETFGHLLSSKKLPARPIRSMHDEKMQLGLTSEGLMKLYDVVGGELLNQDLQTLGIHIGQTPAHLATLKESHAHLVSLRGDLEAAMESQKQLRLEVEDKTKALARARASLQTMTTDAAKYQQELQIVATGQKSLEDELVVQKKKFEEYVESNNFSKLEMSTSQQAAVEMRALLESQIQETEKWQRQCWALQEQLNTATSTCNDHKQKLWQTKEAKKIEERKNMLLYMQAQLGKKHPQIPTA
ncbi:hypothetical protein AeMF1_010718 [Aphanomyces euteiches]|nr:hypothetical protein AeMF1_010718 [Aphanomyces euteiches]